MTTTSLILGTVSICIGVFGGALSPVGFVCGIVAIVLGAISIKRDHLLMDTAKAGFVTGIIGTVISLATSLLVYTMPFIDLSPISDFLGGKFLR
ncbi:MAG: hypothetical protein K6G60_09055 [Lachnospiraceae bacterium]|nr:hypothetical protein [Lachnospiraceae bacterium]